MARTADSELRHERNLRLSLCDWTVLPDSPLTEEKKNEWKVYRQKLRDLPKDSSPKFDKDGVLTGYTFPTKPS